MDNNRNFAQPGQYFITMGPEPINKTDVHFNQSTLPGLVNFCTVRKDNILARKDETNISFSTDPEKPVIILQVGEHGGYLERDEQDVLNAVHTPKPSNYVASLCVTGSLAFTEDHKAVRVMLARQDWGTQELGKKLQELKYLFADPNMWNTIVVQLREIQLKITTVIDDRQSDQGAKTKSIETVIDKAPEINIPLRYRIYKGEQEEHVTLSVAWDVVGGRAVMGLRSYDLVRKERELCEKIMLSTREALSKIFEGNIPFMDVN